MKRLEVTLENPNGILIDLTAEEITARQAEEAKMAELQADYDALQYQRDREAKYPFIKDQLDMQYKDLLNGTTTWKDAVAKVKSDNPKS